MIDYDVRPIPSSLGKAFVKKHHYSHGIHNGPTCWGLYDAEYLLGVIAFATPCSENVRRSVFGENFVDHVTELHRLVVLDGTPKNTESYFIARALHELKSTKPRIWGVLSFADSTVGHIGTIYQATNALYCGTTSSARFYIDETGRLRHPRQNGVNISPQRAQEMGWEPTMRGAKHRYLFLLPDDRRHKRTLSGLLKLPTYTYPKGS